MKYYINYIYIEQFYISNSFKYYSSLYTITV